MPAKDIMTSPLGETHEGAWPYLQGLDQFLTHGTYETYAASAPYRMVRGFSLGGATVIASGFYLSLHKLIEKYDS
jgi:hypothetical protein